MTNEDINTLRQLDSILECYTDEQIMQAALAAEEKGSLFLVDLLKELPRLKLDYMYVVVSEDQDGHEAICFVELEEGKTNPLIATTERRLPLLQDFGGRIARESGRPVSLIKLEARTTIAVYEPV